MFNYRDEVEPLLSKMVKQMEEVLGKSIEYEIKDLHEAEGFAEVYYFMSSDAHLPDGDDGYGTFTIHDPSKANSQAAITLQVWVAVGETTREIDVYDEDENEILKKEWDLEEQCNAIFSFDQNGVLTEAPELPLTGDRSVAVQEMGEDVYEPDFGMYYGFKEKVKQGSLVFIPVLELDEWEELTKTCKSKRLEKN